MKKTALNMKGFALRTNFTAGVLDVGKEFYYFIEKNYVSKKVKYGWEPNLEEMGGHSWAQYSFIQGINKNKNMG